MYKRQVPEGAAASAAVPLAPRTVTVSQDAIQRLQRTVRLEALLLVGVLVLTVLLASQPTP